MPPAEANSLRKKYSSAIMSHDVMRFRRQINRTGFSAHTTAAAAHGDKRPTSKEIFSPGAGVINQQSGCAVEKNFCQIRKTLAILDLQIFCDGIKIATRGRRSTYRRAESVQTTGAGSVAPRE